MPLLCLLFWLHLTDQLIKKKVQTQTIPSAGTSLNHGLHFTKGVARACSLFSLFWKDSYFMELADPLESHSGLILDVIVPFNNSTLLSLSYFISSISEYSLEDGQLRS